MTVHNLYSGGRRQQNSNYGLFPATPPTPTESIPPAGHRHVTTFGIEQIFDFGLASGPLSQYTSQDASGALLVTPGSLLQDVLAIVVERKHRLNYVYFEVLTAGTAGATADIRQVLIATPPTEPTLVTALAAAVSLSTAAAFLYTPSINFNSSANYGIEVRFNEIPVGGLGNLKIAIGANVTRFLTGAGY